MPDGVVRRVAGTIAAGALLEPGAPVIALVSGGADSTALLLALHELGYPVRALHVAHDLRGEGSRADAAACAALCGRLGVPLRTAPGAVPPGGNLEARLRDVRRAAAEAEAASDGARIATGHTRDDRAETVLYRLACSGGTGALAALPPRAGRWVRPLLDLGRDEIRAALRRRGVPWRDDPTNEDPGPARNRIRLEVLPALRGLNPRAVERIARTAALHADERALLDGLADALVEPDGTVDLDRLARAHPALQRLALRRAAASAGVVPGEGDIEALRGWADAGAPTRCLPGGTAERVGRRVRFRGAPAAVPAAVGLPVPGRAPFGDRVVTAAWGPRADVEPALAGRLAVRAVRDGDRLRPGGRTCRDLLARAGVPRADRGRYPVVVADDEPVALPGVGLTSRPAVARGIVLGVRGGCP